MNNERINQANSKIITKLYQDYRNCLIRLEKLKKEYENTPWYKPFTRSSLKDSIRITRLKYKTLDQVITLRF